MASDAVESYQELQRRYDEELAAYQEREAKYRAAFDADPSDPDLAAEYAALESERTKLEGLYDSLQETRSGLATRRDEALNRASSL